jgi:RNA recognition motif-containing protein
MNIYIGNLHFKMNEDELRQLFEAYGEVSTAKIIIDKATGRSKGFGFVEMPNDAEASNALTSLDGKEVNGRALKATEAREREKNDAPRRDFRSGGSSNGGGFDRRSSGGGGYNDRPRGNYNRE